MLIEFKKLPFETGNDITFNKKATSEQELILNSLNAFKDWLENASLGLDDMEKKQLFSWLADNGYFTHPASISFHANTYCGLFQHSAAVANTLAEFTAHLGLKWERPVSPMIVGYFHDLCKMTDYIYIDEDA